MSMRKLIAVLAAVLLFAAVPIAVISVSAVNGYITNGDFETGTADGVNVDGLTAVSPSAALDGNYGLHMKNPTGNWDGAGNWVIEDLEVGSVYKLQMDVKAVSEGLNWALWQDAVHSGIKYVSGYFNIADWTHIEKEFVANSTTAVLNVNGGNTGVSEDVYLDNLKLTKVMGDHTCDVVEQKRVEADCENDGYVKYACDCGEGAYTETIPAIGHAWAESARTDATCGADGSVTNTCGNCGDSVTESLPATGNHSYDNAFDVDCNACGAVREVVNPIAFDGKSISENDYGAGLAFKFNLALDGVAIKENTWNQADFSNATYKGYKVIGVGAIAYNTKYSIDIKGVHMNEFEEDHVSFAFRITNIPGDKLDVDITMTPYLIVEIDGVATTIYGEAQTSTYNEALPTN